MYEEVLTRIAYILDIFVFYLYVLVIGDVFGLWKLVGLRAVVDFHRCHFYLDDLDASETNTVALGPDASHTGSCVVTVCPDVAARRHSV